MSVKPIPDGYHSVTPYLIVKGATKAIESYKQAFAATELMRLDGPGRSVMHAEIQIGDSIVMVADEFPDMNVLSPQSPGSSGASICLYVEDADKVTAAAIDAGATVQRPLQDQFYADRTAMLIDPFGPLWTVSTHIEDVSEEEIERRLGEMNQGANE